MVNHSHMILNNSLRHVYTLKITCEPINKKELIFVLKIKKNHSLGVVVIFLTFECNSAIFI